MFRLEELILKGKKEISKAKLLSPNLRFIYTPLVICCMLFLDRNITFFNEVRVLQSPATGKEMELTTRSLGEGHFLPLNLLFTSLFLCFKVKRYICTRTNYEPLRILFCSSLFACTASLSHSHPSLRNKSERSKKWSLIPKTQG